MKTDGLKMLANTKIPLNQVNVFLFLANGKITIDLLASYTVIKTLIEAFL